MAYELTCSDCPFTSIVDGDIDDLYDVIEAHQEENGNRYNDHFVNVESTSETQRDQATD